MNYIDNSNYWSNFFVVYGTFYGEWMMNFAEFSYGKSYKNININILWKYKAVES